MQLRWRAPAGLWLAPSSAETPVQRCRMGLCTVAGSVLEAMVAELPNKKQRIPRCREVAAVHSISEVSYWR